MMGMLFVVILVIAFGGLVTLGGLALTIVGVVQFVRHRGDGPEASPRYSAPVEQPGDYGLPASFEDEPQWASGVVDPASAGGERAPGPDAPGAPSARGSDAGSFAAARRKQGIVLAAVGAFVLALGLTITLMTTFYLFG